MMTKSNINITSNIYIRNDQDIRKDKEYTEKITGAELLKRIQQRFIGLEAIPFNEIQNKIVSGAASCTYEKNGETSYGPIMKDGVMRWVNRCENTGCVRYNICASKADFELIHREPVTEEDAHEENESLRQFFKDLGITVEDDTVTFKHDKNPLKLIEVESDANTYAEPTEQPVSEKKADSERYLEIPGPDLIINAPLDSHIILNSGPGTGKTYTIIQRLIYILSENLCPAEEIYILCYTRSAKNVVERKIDEAIGQEILQPSAKNICLFTFDSYAAYFLMAMKEQGVIADDFSGDDYNSRIRLFNKYISKEDFHGISYFIVDEIQDLVNDRAQMVLNILKNLECGYLLAGDRCQSIYDYEADEGAALDSVKFYELAEKQFPDDMLRYEISVNRRQNPDLADEASEMRKVLLNKSFLEQNKYAAEVMDRYSENIKIELYIKKLMNEPLVSTAILCRSNGEAEYISGMLCEKGVRHTLNRGVNNSRSLPKWLADVFWDYCFETISREDFIDRFNFRCSLDIAPENVWDYLCKAAKSQDTAVLSVSKLITALSMGIDIPNDFCEEPPLLTVSTIHKAKGSEFDRVILIESDIKLSNDSAEEARVRYVALTRPKDQLITMKKTPKYFKRTTTGRVIETGFHNIYKTSRRFCKCIAVGLTGDIDNTSFVSSDFESALELQEYIVQNVKLYDRLSAKYSRSAGSYEIIHKGKCIGLLSRNMNNEIYLGLDATDYKYNSPDSLDNLYVSGITSEILRKFDKNIPMEFQKSKICFGIQITGLARLKFEKK